jgi:hypothetical protein
MNTKDLATNSDFIRKHIHRFCVQKKSGLWLLAICFLVTGCAANAPRNADDLCVIFKQKNDWYKAAKRTEKRWKVPLQVPMAMMYQESSFKAKARPPKDYLLGVIPWGHVSSAYGYAQAKTGTWKDYKRETGNRWADRDDFSDAIDFMGWFMDKTYRINKVSKWDARGQYLNYHDGWGGYRKGTHKKKAWLLATADKVKTRASRYGVQYRQCKKELDSGWFKGLFM